MRDTQIHMCNRLILWAHGFARFSLVGSYGLFIPNRQLYKLERIGSCLSGNAWLPATEPFKTSQSKGGVEVEVINGVKRIGCVARV